MAKWAATVRDRDHVRTAVLEQLGWTLHRVWSLEWQLNPENKKCRLLDVIVNQLLALVAVEAPILLRQATLRVTQCWNSRAFSQKAHERILAIARDLHRQDRLFLDQDDTLWMSHSQSEGWQTFRRPPADGRPIDAIPMAERHAALLLITREALSMDPDTLLRP